MVLLLTSTTAVALAKNIPALQSYIQLFLINPAELTIDIPYPDDKILLFSIVAELLLLQSTPSVIIHFVIVGLLPWQTIVLSIVQPVRIELASSLEVKKTVDV